MARRRRLLRIVAIIRQRAPLAAGRGTVSSSTQINPLPPVFTTAPTIASVEVGDTIQFTASDPNGQTVTYSLTGSPTGYSISASSGLVTVGTGATSASLVVVATDTTGLATSTTCVVTVVSATPSVAWSVPTPMLNGQPFLPIVPNAAGWGMETTAGSGRSASVPGSAANAGAGTTILFVDSLAATRTGTMVADGASGKYGAGPYGYGTLAWCLARQAQGGAPVAGARTVIPLVSGVVSYDPTTAYNDPIYVAPYTTVAGEAAPAPGLVLYGRGLRMHYSSTQPGHICVRHLTSVWPGQPGYGASAFSCFSLQAQSSFAYQGLVYANCTALWNTSSAFGWQNPGGTQTGTIWQCAVLSPPYLSAGTYTLPSGNAAHVEAIGRGNTYDNVEDRISEMRTLYAHCTFRLPETRALRGYFADSVAYNVGFAGAYFDTGSYGTATSSRTHLRSLVYLDGPNTKNFPWKRNTDGSYVAPAAYLQGAVSFPSANGGRAHLDRVASVGGLTPLLYGPYVSHVDSTAYSGIDPEGYTARAYVASGNYDRTLTVAQVREQVELVCSTAGSRPRTRIPEAAAIVNQVLAKAQGQATGLGAIWGGYEYSMFWPAPTIAAVAQNTISNPLAPGAYWNDSPCPISQRNTIAASGYTVLEEWLHARHAEVM